LAIPGLHSTNGPFLALRHRLLTGSYEDMKQKKFNKIKMTLRKKNHGSFSDITFYLIAEIGKVRFLQPKVWKGITT